MREGQSCLIYYTMNINKNYYKPLLKISSVLMVRV